MTAEDLLTRTFAEVVETTDYPTTPVTTVVARSQAGRASRRRRIAFAAAAAVVAAGGLSAALTLRGDHGTTPGPTGPLGDLRQGPPPKIDYVDGDTFVTPSGQRFTSRRIGASSSAVAWGKGVLVTSRPTSRHPTSTVSFVTNGPAIRVGCGTETIAVPPDGGDPVYWLGAGCSSIGGGRLVQGHTSTDTSKGVTLSPVGQVAGGIVSAATSGQVRLPSHTLVVPLGTGRTVPLPLALPWGASESADLVSGLAENGEDSLVVDATTGEVRWRARYWTLSRFSPSGRYVAGDQVVGEQSVQTMGDIVGIFDAATGHPALTLVLRGLSVNTRPVWEGDDAVLVVAHDHDGQEAIIRVGLDGTVTRASRVVQDALPPEEGRPPPTILQLAATP